MNCDRCGNEGATVERMQSGSHWWFHPECEHPRVPAPVPASGGEQTPIGEMPDVLNRIAWELDRGPSSTEREILSEMLRGIAFDLAAALAAHEEKRDANV